MNWYIEVMRKYAVFQGRARRKEYWMFLLFNVLIAFGLGFAMAFLSAMLGFGQSLVNATSTIYSLAVLIPGIAVGVRRMHDIGRSGWWIFFPIVNLVMFCLNSQNGENEYGPNPKGA
jgi:uncharacterized membrane protein YhaH (DUF805 family)